MSTAIAVISTTLLVFAGFIIWMQYAQIAEDEELIDDLVTELLTTDKKVEEDERVIAMLMERELTGTWFPNVDAEHHDLAELTDPVG